MKKPLKVAVIDDNTDYLFSMETFFRKAGCDIFTADNGQNGLDLIRAEKPDVVLLDIMMETLFSGFELCQAIRSDPELEYTPIISISGMAEVTGIHYDKWRDYPYFKPDEFIEKPVDKSILMETIARVIKDAEEHRKWPQWKKEQEEGYTKRDNPV